MTRRRNINPRPRHIPQRTCVACGRVEAKRQLVRLVRVPGGIQVDPSGRMTGRGAYLCPLSECWQSGLKRGGRLEHALRTSITPKERERLLQLGTQREERPSGSHGE